MLAKILTIKSNLCLFEYPQTVAGLIVTVVKLLSLYLFKIFSQSALMFLMNFNGFQ